MGFVLHLAGNGDKTRAHHNPTKSLEDMRPDDDVGDGSFIFDRHEGALSAARALTHEDKTRHRDAASRRDFSELLVAQNAPATEGVPQKDERMGLQRKMQMTVVFKHLLAWRHRRKLGVRFAV